MHNLNIYHTESQQRVKIITVISYEIYLDFTKKGSTFYSETRVKFFAKPGENSFIDLIAQQVNIIKLNGKNLDIEKNSSNGRIQLSNLEETNELTIIADMNYMNSGEGMHRFVDPEDNETYLYTQFEVPDSRRVFAVFEQPDMKATFQFNITAPKYWQVISNSPTPKPQDLSPTVSFWAFSPTAKISSYITAIIAGPYEKFSSEYNNKLQKNLPLNIFSRKSLAKYVDSENIFDITKAGFKFYEDIFHAPYPFEKYDQIFVPDFNSGAMENAAAVTFLESYIFRNKASQAILERRALTILHELAHMWFGNLVTMRWWNDLWLNESFAEYISTLATAEVTQWKEAWNTFAFTEKGWAYKQDQLPTTHPIVAKIDSIEDVLVNFDGITYAKGAAVLKQLVSWVGKENFLESINNYFRKYAWKNAELKNFLYELEETSGRDLKAWSKNWLETAGVNTIKAKFTTDSSNQISEFIVEQTGPILHSTLRSHRIEIGFYDLLDHSVKLVKKIEIDIAGKHTIVPDIVGINKSDIIVLNNSDLSYTKIRFDKDSLNNAIENLSLFEDSLTKTLIWASLWDMTRDAELSAARYLSIVLDNIAREDNSSIRSTLLQQINTIVEIYLPPNLREKHEINIADKLWELANNTSISYDAQQQFFKAFVKHAKKTPHVDVVQKIFIREIEVPRIIVDTDMLWHLIKNLAAFGYVNILDIEQQLSKDNTANGLQEKNYAQAAIPNIANKQHTWKNIISGKLSNNDLENTISGFMRALKPEILEPFVEPYFQIITKIWENETYEISQSIISGLYPTILASEKLVLRTQEWLNENPNISPALQRLMLENLDTIVRATKVMEAN